MIRRILAFLRTLRELHWERTRGLEHVRKLRDRFPTCEFHGNVFVRDDCDLGDFVVVWQNNYLSNCTVGRCTYFAPGSKIGNCDIGAFCSIGPEVRIGLGIHPTRGYVSTYPGFYSTNPYSCKIRFREDPSVSESARIRIGNDVWTGAGHHPRGRQRRQRRDHRCGRGRDERRGTVQQLWAECPPA